MGAADDLSDHAFAFLFGAGLPPGALEIADLAPGGSGGAVRGERCSNGVMVLARGALPGRAEACEIGQRAAALQTLPAGVGAGDGIDAG
jgi:hypothetical protein